MQSSFSNNKLSFVSVFITLICVPLIYGVYVVYTKTALGPYWLGSNIDPAYQYLLNGLNILQGVVPAHVDHPGTTLQLLCAAVIAVVSWVRPGALLTDFFQHPEVYMQAVSWVLIGLQLFSFLLLGWFAWQKTHDRLFVFLVQLGTLLVVPLLSYPSYGGVIAVPINVFPETLLIVLTHFFMIGLLAIVFHHDKPCWGWLGFYLGIVAGLALVTKISFGVLIIIPFILLRHVGARLIYVALTAVTFAIATIPVWSKFDKMFGFMSNIVAHSGRHGIGGGAWLEWQDVTTAAMQLFAQHGLIVMVLIIVILGGLLIWLIFSRRFSGAGGMLGVISCVVVGQLFLILRHYSEHYLTPLLCLLGLGLALMYWLLREKKIAVKLTQVLLVFVCLMIGFHVSDYHDDLKKREQSLIQFSSTATAVAQEKRCMLIPFFRSSTPAYALSYGLIQGGGWGHQPYVDVLTSLYPQQMFYHKWAHMLHDFKQMIPMPTAYQFLTQQRGACMILYGQEMELDRNRFAVETLETSGFKGGEGLFLIKNLK